ncbi:MAG: restriction endonuclease subunit S [Anaerolineaceae bacterium]|nr:restriction endonuclease subunit S [Anaerolineaceae bacterium]
MKTNSIDQSKANDYKETEFGTIPSTWEVVSIGSIGKVVTGSTPSTKKSEYYGGPYKLISPSDLDNGKYVSTAHNWLTKAGLKVARILPKDSVLVGCIGNVGKLGMTSDEKSATNQQINAIVCSSHVDADFIFYLLYHSRDRLNKYARKTTVPILNKTNFEKITVPLPRLKEQKQIASVLNTLQEATHCVNIGWDTPSLEFSVEFEGEEEHHDTKTGRQTEAKRG